MILNWTMVSYTTPKTQITKEKLDKVDFNKTVLMCVNEQTTIRKMKGQLRMGENVWKSYI